MRYLLPLVFIVIVLIFIVGCTSENKSSTLDPSEMALQISDLPSGYVKTNSDTINLVQNNQNFWNVKKGYQVGFAKGSTKTDIVIVGQAILVVPIDKINQVLPNISSQYGKMGTQVVQLSNPDIGDSSIAFRVENPQEGFETSGESFNIAFVKQDVVEIIVMTGAQTDYDVLKTLAKKALEKIK